MVKIIKRAAIVILLLLLICWGWLTYRQYSSFRNVIHEDAQLVIKVKVDQLFRKIALNTVSNPGYYLKKDTIKEEAPKAKDGLAMLPGNLFIYNLSNHPRTFFATLKIADTTQFKAYIKKQLPIDTFTTSNNLGLGVSGNGKWKVCYNNNQAALAYSFANSNDTTSLTEILSGQHFIPNNSRLISALKKVDGDVSIVQKSNTTELNFESGSIDIKGIFDIPEYLQIPAEAKVSKRDTSSNLHLRMAGQFKPGYFNDYTIENITMPVDSLLNYYNGYLDIKIAGSTLQRDSIISYEYNDNFEKVEKASIQESIVPGINIFIKSDAENLYQLLQRNNLVKGNYVNRKVFPLLQLNITQNEDKSLLLTNTNTTRNPQYIQTPHFFSLYVDMDDQMSQYGLPLPGAYWDIAQEFQLSASKKVEQIVMEGQLMMTNQHINALVQLMDGGK